MIYDYNVYAEGEGAEIDHWTEDEAEARATAAEYHREHGEWPTITRYPTRLLGGQLSTDTTTWEIIAP
jgi:hypothetical protein